MDPSTLQFAVTGLVVVQQLGFGLSGLACCYFGFRLFSDGVVDGGAKMSVERGKAGTKVPNFRFGMAKGGPGLIFALFGMAIIVCSLVTKSTSRLEVMHPSDGVASAEPSSCDVEPDYIHDLSADNKPLDLSSLLLDPPKSVG